MSGEGQETFEERVSGSLDALFDGATLLVGQPDRAEALVVSVVVEAARTYPRPEGEGFRKWILGRLIRHYVRYVEAAHDGEERKARQAGSGSEPVANRDTTLDALLLSLAELDRAGPEQLGEIVRGCMGELPVRERAALWLVNVMQFSYAEAARVLGMRLGLLRETLYRARKDLQGRLAVALQRELSDPGRLGRASGDT
ncbi:MAG: RNA polymerase sigma factor [Gemmatimonadota bacterium]